MLYILTPEGALSFIIYRVSLFRKTVSGEIRPKVFMIKIEFITKMIELFELFHPGVASLTPAQPHTIAEIDHEISSLAIPLSLPLSQEGFLVYARSTGTTLSSLPSKNVWCTCFASLAY